MIAAAVVCFILFVSTQALRDWPISDLNFGGGNDSASVSPAQSLGGRSANAAATNLKGPITATPARAGAATKAGGGNGTPTAHKHHATGKVSPEAQIQGGRGVDSAPVKQPSSTSPAPAPTSGSAPPAGSGTASPAPSGGGSTPAGGNSAGGNSGGGNSGGGNSNSGGGQVENGNVGTRTARSVTHAVQEISSTATPPAPSPVTSTVNAVEEKVSQAPPSPGSTTEKVAGAVAGIGK